MRWSGLWMRLWIRLLRSFRLVDVHYFGGPAMSVYNARQIKRDTLCHVHRGAGDHYIVHSVCVQASPFHFSDSMSGDLRGGFRACNVVADTRERFGNSQSVQGTAIIGIALSYSIHFLAHQNYVRSVTQLLEELCQPVDHRQRDYNRSVRRVAFYFFQIVAGFWFVRRSYFARNNGFLSGFFTAVPGGAIETSVRVKCSNHRKNQF